MLPGPRALATQPEEIRKLFNIVNDFSPEEEAQIKKVRLPSRPLVVCLVARLTCRPPPPAPFRAARSQENEWAEDR